MHTKLFMALLDASFARFLSLKLSAWGLLALGRIQPLSPINLGRFTVRHPEQAWASAPSMGSRQVPFAESSSRFRSLEPHCGFLSCRDRNSGRGSGCCTTKWWLRLGAFLVRWRWTSLSHKTWLSAHVVLLVSSSASGDKCLCSSMAIFESICIPSSQGNPCNPLQSEGVWNSSLILNHH